MDKKKTKHLEWGDRDCEMIESKKLDNYLSQNKIFNHLDRVQEWLESGKCFPVTIELDPTNICTNNCVDCAGNRCSQESSLSLNFMKDVIWQIKPFCRGLIFTGGGEPLCNQGTIDAMEYARKNGVDVALNTNADIIDESLADRVSDVCSYVRVSVYNDRSWEKIMLLVWAKQEKKTRCTIGVGFLTSEQRMNMMRGFVEKAKKSGVDYAQFRPYHLDTFDVSLVIDELKKEYDSDEFKVIASDYKYVDMEQRVKKSQKYPIALADNFRTVIAADGKIYPDCWTRGKEEFCLGDLSNSSFQDIWKSERRDEMLNSKLRSPNCPPMCYHDPLNELLWNIRKEQQMGTHTNELLRGIQQQKQKCAHMNFV